MACITCSSHRLNGGINSNFTRDVNLKSAVEAVLSGHSK